MPLLIYTALRVAVFAVVAAILYLTAVVERVGWGLSAVIAIVLAALISYLAFPKQRVAAARRTQQVAERVSSSQKQKRTEEDREDELIDAGGFENGDEIEADGTAPDGSGDVQR